MNLREELTSIKNSRRGALKQFCDDHDLDYNAVYRVAMGMVLSPGYEFGKKLEKAVSAEKPRDQKAKPEVA